MLLKNVELWYQCVKCDYIFQGNTAMLFPIEDKYSEIKTKGIKSVIKDVMFKYIDERGKIMGGTEPPTLKDYWMGCPRCQQIHKFGFLERKRRD